MMIQVYEYKKHEHNMLSIIHMQVLIEQSWYIDVCNSE
jgi:hypothetical protein